jgi:hypothetical protein
VGHGHHRRSGDGVAGHGPAGDLQLDLLDHPGARVGHEGPAHGGLLGGRRDQEQLAQAGHGLGGRVQPGRAEPVIVGEEDQRRFGHERSLRRAERAGRLRPARRQRQHRAAVHGGSGHVAPRVRGLLRGIKF